MEAFIKLRAAARLKRNKAIEHAHREYELTLAAIAALEQDLLGKESSRHKMISASIERVIPSDREFTIPEIMAGLEALDPGRAWRKRSVDHHISRLRQRGIIRRVDRHRGTDPSVYIRSDISTAPRPFEDMTLAEAIASIVTEPMHCTAIVVALSEGGYKSRMDLKALRKLVAVELRKGGFVKEGLRWAKA